MKLYYKSGEVQKLTGLTFRQLQHWDKIGLVKPRRAGGNKTAHRVYSFKDLCLLAVIATRKKYLNKSVFSQKQDIDRIRGLLDTRKYPLEEANILMFDDIVILHVGDVFWSGPLPEPVVTIQLSDLILKENS